VVVVSYFNPRDLLGGAERIAWAEAELLAATREVAFLSASNPAEDAGFAQYRVAAWTRRLYQPPGRHRSSLALALFHLLSLFNPVAFVESFRRFRSLRPTVVHTHNLLALSPAVWLAARLAGARGVHTQHDLWLLCERATMTNPSGSPCGEGELTCRLCKALRAPKRAQLGLVSTEIFPSGWLRDRLARCGEVVSNFATTYASRSPGIVAPANPPTFIYVGALTAHKLGVLLEAFELAAAEFAAPVSLKIAGSGPLAGKVSAAAEASPKIVYLGPLDPHSRDRLLETAVAAIVPSTCAESSSLVFYEALAVGIPVIASDIGGISEHERFGNLVLVPPGDADGLARAILDLLRSGERAAHLRSEALRHRSEASPERYAEAIGVVLDRVRSR
jgi:glycogen(starch) synthase